MLKVFKTFENDGSDFSAIYTAETWLKENGYSIGSMQGDAPIGVAKGDHQISKWRNLGDDIGRLDGQLESTDYRHNSVVLKLKDDAVSPEALAEFVGAISSPTDEEARPFIARLAKRYPVGPFRNALRIASTGSKGTTEQGSKGIFANQYGNMHRCCTFGKDV